jgi:hypothetical protein
MIIVELFGHFDLSQVPIDELYGDDERYCKIKTVRK